MIMEEAQDEFMGSNDFSLHQHHRRHHHQIVKGKRTKRQRSSSPYKVVASSSSSSGYGGGGGEGEREVVVAAEEFGSVSSPPTSSGGDIYESTEEEEDMANCLILLAQGDHGRSRQINGGGNGKKERFNPARKFSDIATTTNKAGFYVYECKTCNRSFPSFQALGGHRASHKKPKPSPEEKKPDAVPGVAPVALMEDLELCQLNKSNTPDHDDHPASLQIATATTSLAAAANNSSSSSSSNENSNNNNNNNNNNNSNNKGLHGNKVAKVHECSICGSEFMSGQALGGHMRRHRANATSSTSNNQVLVTGTIDTSAATTIDESNINNGEIKPTRTVLPLNLNLPAPEDDHHHREPSTFQFTATQQQQQQQPLVFSAPALVDCHY